MEDFKENTSYSLKVKEDRQNPNLKDHEIYVKSVSKNYILYFEHPPLFGDKSTFENYNITELPNKKKGGGAKTRRRIRKPKKHSRKINKRTRRQ